MGNPVHIGRLGEEFPADCILLQSSVSQGLCNIETSNLDGYLNFFSNFFDKFFKGFFSFGIWESFLFLVIFFISIFWIFFSFQNLHLKKNHFRSIS